MSCISVTPVSAVTWKDGCDPKSWKHWALKEWKRDSMIFPGCACASWNFFFTPEIVRTVKILTRIFVYNRQCLKTTKISCLGFGNIVFDFEPCLEGNTCPRNLLLYPGKIMEVSLCVWEPYIGHTVSKISKVPFSFADLILFGLQKLVRAPSPNRKMRTKPEALLTWNVYLQRTGHAQRLHRQHGRESDVHNERQGT